MTRLCLLLALVLSGTAALAYADDVAIGGDGQPVLAVAGHQPVTGTLFIHYGRWVYRNAGALRPDGNGGWVGSVSVQPEDGAGTIRIVLRSRPVEGGVRLEYEFTPEGTIDLRRGVQLALRFAYPDYAGRAVTFSHGPAASTDRNFNVAARSCSVNLTDDEALRISLDRATRFTTYIGESRDFSLNVELTPSTLDEPVRTAVELRAVPAVTEVPSWRAQPSEQPLALRGVEADRATVGRFETVEFTLDMSATYENPYDPDQVAVNAVIVTPSGARERVAGFYCQGFDAEYENGAELLAISGPPQWKVRYTPREPGSYRATFAGTDRSGTTPARELTFRCVESAEPGFLRISDGNGAGPRYFRDDRGESVFLIGHNVTTYQPDLDEVFGLMKGGGENYTRFWMYSAALGLQWGLPVGEYRAQEAWRLDHLLDLAHRHGIHIMLCLDTHQDFRNNWDANPYNAANGGPCEEVMDFFRSPEARRIYEKRLRYVVARWGSHPNVMCWEFGNEMEGWIGAQENREDVARWHADMARVLAGLDPYDHPITSSLWTTEGWPELWDLPEMDFVQTHYYANNLWADMAGDVASICRQKRRDWPDKLHVFGEYGVDYRGGTAAVDPGGINLHNGNWAALMTGSASDPVSWWHGDYIHPLGLYRVYRGLAAFVAGEPLADREWKPVEVASVAYVRPPALRYKDFRFSGHASAWEAPIPDGTVFTVNREGDVANLDDLPDLIHGQSHRDLQRPFVFEVDALGPTRFGVRVGRVSAGGVLEFRVDGEPVRTVNLPTGEDVGEQNAWREQWQLWESTYNRTYEVDVPAGRHIIELHNTGRDWVTIDFIQLADYVTNERPPLRVLGQVTGDRAMLWVQNTEHTWFNAREGRPIPPVEPTAVVLRGFADGRWTVETWDTVTGEALSLLMVRAAAGELRLPLPEIATDLAMKLRPLATTAR
jgi:hypothetical protein